MIPVPSNYGIDGSGSFRRYSGWSRQAKGNLRRRGMILDGGSCGSGRHRDRTRLIDRLANPAYRPSAGAADSMSASSATILPLLEEQNFNQPNCKDFNAGGRNRSSAKSYLAKTCKIYNCR